MILLALGLCVGLVLALTGAGGAIIAVPLLMFGMGWTLTQAGPVALLAVAGSAAMGAVIGLKGRMVRYRAACLMAVAGVLVAPLGMGVAHVVPRLPLVLGFATLLLWVAWRMWAQARAQLRGLVTVETGAGVPCLIDPDTGRFCWTNRCGWSLVLAGLGSGFLSGLFGVGGGFLIVPTLRKVTDLPMNAIVATSMTVIALVSSAAVVSAALAGHLPLLAALPFAVGALIGMSAGRLVASRIAGPRLQQGFAGLVLVVAIMLAIRALLA